MSEFKIPEEWRNEFIKTYIPLIAGVDSVEFINIKLKV